MKKVKKIGLGLILFGVIFSYLIFLTKGYAGADKFIGSTPCMVIGMPLILAGWAMLTLAPEQRKLTRLTKIGIGFFVFLWVAITVLILFG